MSNLTTRHGYEIAKKLKVEPKKKRGHDQVVLAVDGIVSGSYGLSRGSRAKTKTINGTASQIWLSVRQALLLARCPMSKEQYEDHIRAQRLRIGYIRNPIV